MRTVVGLGMLLVAFTAGTLAGAAPPGIPVTQAPALTSTTVPPFYRAPHPLTPGPQGSLIRAERVTGVPGVPKDARVWRVLYRSRTVGLRDVAVSGYVVAPATGPPPGGYPVLAWAHGTTGMAAPCAPSLFTNLEGQHEYLAPYLDQYLARDYVVAASDYQGLGTGPLHPYLVGPSEGMNVLDSVRAAGQLPGLRLSRDVVVVGHSQGGQAALFAGQLASSYAPELAVRGVVAIAPATNLSAAVAVVASLSSHGGISHGQGDLDFVAMALWAWAHTYPHLAVSSVFTALGAATMKVAGTGCLPQIARSLEKVDAAQILQPRATTDPRVEADAARNDPGAVRTTAPMLVIQGTKDQTVPYELTNYFVAHQACTVGDSVRYTLYTGQTHSGVIPPAAGEVLGWIAQRLAGSPAQSTCGTPPEVAS